MTDRRAGHTGSVQPAALVPYRMLVERMQVGAATLSGTGDILFCNPYLALLLGRTLGEVSGHSLSRFVDVADHAALARLLAEAREPDGREVAFVRADGRRVPVKLSVADLPRTGDAPHAFCAIFTDLTPIRLRNRALAEAAQQLRGEIAVRRIAEADRERLAAVVDETPSLVALFDRMGRLSYVNLAGRRLSGLPPAAPGQDISIHAILPPNEAVRWEAEILPALLRQGRWSGELDLCPIGLPASVPVQAEVFLIAGGGVGREDTLAMIARDISAQRTLEAQRRAAQKMEAVGQLTGGIAHDFNNLLTGIMGSLQLMQKRLAQGRYHALDRHLPVALESAERAAMMTQRLLAFSRRQPLVPRAVDAGALMITMADGLRCAAGPAIALEIDCAADAWPTLCDADQLKAVLIDLVLNGHDAMTDAGTTGGRMVVACRNLDLSDPVAASARGMTPGDYLEIEVSDTGAGMTAETMAQAFEPFFTTKDFGHGSGLGLSMVYGFARQSGGQVRLSSTVGVGTTVSLYLPRLHALRAPAIPEAPPQSAFAVERHDTVLVVEDETPVRSLVLEVLGDMGLRTIEASNGLQGLRTIQSDARIDLLVTDVGLPGLNGRQLAEAARLLRPGLRVLFMTGYSEDPLFVQEVDGAGMQMITKPFAIAALEATVRTMIAAPMG